MCIYLCMCMSMLVFFSFFHFEGQYLMDDSDFQVVLVLISFVIFQNRKKNVVFAHTQKSQSQSQNLRLSWSQSQSQTLRPR